MKFLGLLNSDGDGRWSQVSIHHQDEVEIHKRGLFFSRNGEPFHIQYKNGDSKTHTSRFFPVSPEHALTWIVHIAVESGCAVAACYEDDVLLHYIFVEPGKTTDI